MGELQGEWHHAASGVVERSGRWFQKFFAGRWSPGVHRPIVANNGCNTEVLQVALCTSMHSAQEVCNADLHFWNAAHQWLCSFGCQNLNIGVCGFGIKPSIHLFKHMLYSYKLLLLSGCERFVSLLLFNCEQNEDLIGRMGRLSRRLDSRQVSRRCLECYLLKAGMLWTRFKRTHGIWQSLIKAKDKETICVWLPGLDGLGLEVGIPWKTLKRSFFGQSTFLRIIDKKFYCLAKRIKFYIAGGCRYV